MTVSPTATRRIKLAQAGAADDSAWVLEVTTGTAFLLCFQSPFLLPWYAAGRLAPHAAATCGGTSSQTVRTVRGIRRWTTPTSGRQPSARGPRCPPRPTAAVPVDNPYRSCRLRREPPARPWQGPAVDRPARARRLSFARKACIAVGEIVCHSAAASHNPFK